MKLVLAATGASGAIYTQRLLDRLDPRVHEIHLVQSNYSKQVAGEELPGGRLAIPEGVRVYDDRSMIVPFTSGSARFDAMVVAPCSMGTLARIAHGTSESPLLRGADVFLKERRTLVLVPRETPWSLVHARNVVAVMEAGARVLPAIPSFYHRPGTVEEVVDTVVFRILDQLGLPDPRAPRWQTAPGAE